MGQATVTETTDERRWSRALRPLVLLGGFVLLWWVLMTGAAQADDGPDGGLADTARHATGSLERAVDHPVRRTVSSGKAHQHRAPVGQLTRTVRAHVNPVVSPVTAPVGSVAKQTVENNVKPVTTRTTDAVRSTVDKVAKGVESGLENGPAKLPELHADKAAVPPLVTAESSTRVGETRSHGSLGRPFAAPTPVLPAVGLADDLGTLVTAPENGANASDPNGPDMATPTPLPGDQQGGGAVIPAEHEGTSSAPSGNGGSVTAADTAAALVIAPATARTSTVSSVDRLPAGPTYPPASSPD
jgi:hypothetical protein